MSIELIKKWVWPILVLVLVILLFLKSCGTPKIKETIVTTHDTAIVTHTDTLTKDSLVYVKIKPKPTPPPLIPSKNNDSLRKQYDSLLSLYTDRKAYSDTLKIDSIGWVSIQDTVEYNQLGKRTYFHNIRERIITNTTTITKILPNKNKFYIGGEIGTNFNGTFNSLNLGLLFQSKKDVILRLAPGYNFTQKEGEIRIGLYKKLHL